MAVEAYLALISFVQITNLKWKLIALLQPYTLMEVVAFAEAFTF